MFEHVASSVENVENVSSAKAPGRTRDRLEYATQGGDVPGFRRGDPAPAVLQEQYDAYFDELKEIAAGRLNIAPGANSFSFGPSITNFQFDVGESRARPRP